MAAGDRYLPPSEPDDINLSVKINGAQWCPVSCAEWQRPIYIVHSRGQPVFAVRRKKGFQLVGPCPVQFWERIRICHEAGAEIDTCFLDSDPDRRMVVVNIYIGAGEIEAVRPKIDRLLERDRQFAREQKARADAEHARLAQRRQRRRQRRKAVFLWGFRMIGRGTSAAWAMAFKRAS